MENKLTQITCIHQMDLTFFKVLYLSYNPLTARTVSTILHRCLLHIQSEPLLIRVTLKVPRAHIIHRVLVLHDIIHYVMILYNWMPIEIKLSFCLLSSNYKFRMLWIDVQWMEFIVKGVYRNWKIEIEKETNKYMSMLNDLWIKQSKC